MSKLVGQFIQESYYRLDYIPSERRFAYKYFRVSEVIGGRFLLGHDVRISFAWFAAPENGKHSLIGVEVSGRSWCVWRVLSRRMMPRWCIRLKACWLRLR